MMIVKDATMAGEFGLLFLWLRSQYGDGLLCLSLSGAEGEQLSHLVECLIIQIEP